MNGSLRVAFRVVEPATAVLGNVKIRRACVYVAPSAVIAEVLRVAAVCVEAGHGKQRRAGKYRGRTDIAATHHRLDDGLAALGDGHIRQQL